MPESPTTSLQENASEETAQPDIINLPDRIVCATPEELFASKDFKRFLATYNQQNPDAAINSVKDLAKNYLQAMELYHFWLQREALGKVSVIRDIDQLALNCLTQIKKVDTERTLDWLEMRDRFRKLGVGIPFIAQNWYNFYKKSGYTSLSDSKVSFYLPSTTEGEMQAFEKDFAEGKIDRVMLDDDRVPFMETLKHFSPTQTLGDANRLESMITVRAINTKGLEDEDTVDLYQHAQRQTADRGIRIVGYKSSLPDDHRQAFKDGIPENEHESIMDIGTLIRLIACLHKEHQREKKSKHALHLETDYETFMKYNVSTLTNGVFPNGKIAMVNHGPRASGEGSYFSIKQVSPNRKQFPAVVRKVIQSAKS